MESQGKIEKLMRDYKMGSCIEKIGKVTGGLSHKMYQVTTDKGVYAIKELNQGVMKRKEAYDNFLFSEKVANIAIENGVLAIDAIGLEKDVIKCIEDSYFMVFPWLDGEILDADEVSQKHCRIMGKTLAKIHSIDFSSIEDPTRKNIEIEELDWNQYLELAKRKNKSYSNLLQENCALLDEFSRKAKEALKYANTNLVLSHRDLDRKNVMWKDELSYIIDWEASGYVNPTIELILLAWYWSGGDVQNINYDKFKIVIEEYKKYAEEKIEEKIDKIIYAGIYDGLGWIDYNLKRSLCLENQYEQEEIELAQKEVIQSIHEIKYYVSQINSIVEMMKY